jgi:hypothetical protein
MARFGAVSLTLAISSYRGWLRLNFDSWHIRQIRVPVLCALENEVMVWRPLGKGGSGLPICQALLNGSPELGNGQGSVSKK